MTDMIQTPRTIMKSVSPKILKRKFHIPQLRVEDSDRRASCPIIQNNNNKRFHSDLSVQRSCENLTVNTSSEFLLANHDEALQNSTNRIQAPSTTNQKDTKPVRYRSLSPQPMKSDHLKPDFQEIRKSVSDPDVSIIWSPIMHRMGHGRWDKLNGTATPPDGQMTTSKTGASDINKSNPDHDMDHLERKSRKHINVQGGELVIPTIVQDQLQADFDSPEVDGDLPTDASDNTDCTDDEVHCSGHEHAGHTTVDEIFEMSVEDMFNNLFTQSEFFLALMVARKTYDLDLCGWDQETDSEGHLHRAISYTLTLTNPLGPKNSYVREEQIRYKHFKSGFMYVIDCEVNNSGVPYGDNFYVVNRYCITRSGHQKCRLRVNCQIKYRKNVWGVVKTFIEKNVTQGLNEHFTFLAAALRRESQEKIAERKTYKSTRKSVKQLQEIEKEKETWLSAPGTPPSQRSERSDKGGIIHDQPSIKKRIRRRRRCLGELNQSPSRLPDVASHVNHVSSRMSAPSRPQEEITVSTTNVESQLKIFSIVLLVLILLNILLYYNVCVMEIAVKQQYPHSTPTKLPESASEWRSLLEQQQRLHDAELERWKTVISSTILLVDQVKQTLGDVQSSLDRQLASTRFTQQQASPDNDNKS